MTEPKCVFVDELPLTDSNAAVIVDTIRIAALTISTAILMASPDPAIHKQPPVQVAERIWNEISDALRAPATIRQDLATPEEE